MLTRTKFLVLIGGVLLGALVFGAGGLRPPGQSEPNWRFPAPPPTPKPNRYDLYIQADAAIFPPLPAVDQVWDTNGQSPEGYYSLARRQQWLKANARGFALLRQAPYFPIVRPANQSSSAKAQHIARFSKLVRAKITEANSYALAEQYILAFYSGLGAYQIALDSAVGGDDSDLSEGFSRQREVLGCLEKIVPHLTTLQAAALARRVERMAGSATTLGQALEVDKWGNLRRLKAAMARDDWQRGPVVGPVKFPANSEPKLAAFDETVAWNDYFIERAGLPYRAEVPAPGLEPGPLVRDFVPFEKFLRLQVAYLANRANLRLFIMSLHLQAFRLEKDRYPNDLGEFKDLRPSVLTDPFSPALKNIGYRREGEGYLIWSVGPNAIDNYGKPIPSMSRFGDVNQGARGDIVLSPRE